ncbi:NADH dehydrogenase 1 alpha subcomplex assembly factor 3 [Dactylonectria macrodidyma]|uniref:NADH dehydrogenase [ubiquinone] 1 alpha subcomplex assembly factor 3 n=1 Tax=Dactylonectria macrodidyma TaxID=307937 RepID=A0A9P9EJK9_9HYPO|nr:NADH dehydrogenase 1 alpha subcomplex assembly factor 3 [Dactylonectria macrodidyma]
MAARCFMRPCADPRALRHAVSQTRNAPSKSVATALRCHAPPSASLLGALPQGRRLFHAVPSRSKKQEVPAHSPPTNFKDLDVLGDVPVPSTSVDVCTYDGFGLNSGVMITDGNGVMLVDGEVFNWRPWEAKGSMNLANKKGQFEIPPESFALFDLIWPRPDLLIIGTGASIMPLSPETRRHISKLGIRIELLDTRNAAAQFNLLATERGVSDVAAALIPIGWKEGVGAK